MKKLLITYQMQNQNGTAENRIALSMVDEIADDILTKGANNSVILKNTLKHITALQGYDYVGFCTAEEVKN